MIKIENIETYGWKTAIRGMRNPKNSWNRIDSDFTQTSSILGENDLKLATQLAGAGPVHGKFLRMINVTMDITAPLYWWKEFDTYKVGTVANSCSTMHKIHAKEFTSGDFSHEHLTSDMFNVLEITIGSLNMCRKQFLETKNKMWWWQMIQLLPSSYNQKRTVQMNYEVLRNIYKYRRNHKLDEWVEFCDYIKLLPYCELITRSVKANEI